MYTYDDILSSLKKANVNSGIADLLYEEYDAICNFGKYHILNDPQTDDPTYKELRETANKLANEVNYYFCLT